MSNLTDITNLSDDGLDAVMAIRTISIDETFTFDGIYSNADVAAIADAFERKNGKRPPFYWTDGLRDRALGRRR